MRLKLKLTVIIVIIMVAVIGAISIILLTRASATAVEVAQENLENMTGIAAGDLASRYQVYVDVLQTLAQIMADYQSVEPALRRGQFTEIITAIMESRTNFIGMYTVWKPNIIDNRNGELANTPGTDASGNFIVWISRDRGYLEQRAYTNWQNVLAEVKRVPIIGDPERLNISGKDLMVTNITVPIIPQGSSDIVGLIGVNFELSLSQKIVSALKPYGNGRAILISNNGTVAAHYDPSKIGSSAEEVLLPVIGTFGVNSVREGLKAGSPKLFSSNGRICDVYPFYVGENDTPWALLSSVESSRVLAEVNSLIRFTFIMAFIAIFVSAIIIFFTAANIVKPIVNVSLTLKDISEGEGDLTKTIALKSKDEVGDLARYFNQTLEKIKNLVVVIK
ncbi:MAG: cache and HAMP domain-containing protein, partial [Spirochaetaceae bacterium]|nr:cache and HAMP domain-containing protein [Spirochaetaceae bacterium]